MGRSQDYFFKIICAPSCLGKRELGVTRLLGMGLGMHRCVASSENLSSVSFSSLLSHVSIDWWAGTCRSKTSFDMRDFGLLCWQSLW